MTCEERARAITARARAAIGTRSRPQGRQPGLSLDCVGLVVDALRAAGPIVEPPRDYCLRADNGERLVAALAKAGLRRRKAMRPADVVQLLVAAGQHHLGIATPTGLVHADFSVGRVVESTIPADWRLLSAWRLTIDEEI